MTIEIILLALASAVRPTSLVAVWALVRESPPTRLMVAYLAAGLAFTVTVGVAVIFAFSGIDIHAGTDRTKAIAEILAGVLALGLGIAVLAGRIRVGAVADGRPAEARAERLRRRRVTTRTAALAGPATHIPGLLYILALDLIVTQEPGVPGGLLEIGIYNAIWYALPIVVLAICIVKPSAARTLVQKLQEWAGAHARTIVLLISFGMGGWLLIEGASTI
ncbi:MAG TPA: GAP family protein [Solirubrobacteraceae bacterium]|nr:GAP family protein [Solirubrobacteraceae bacterium]